jgi:ATP phosphoribosyltransferase regulatory subunit
MKTLTPFGVRDLTPTEATRHSTLQHQICSVFKADGYQKIVTPTIEYFDSLSMGMGPVLQKDALKFFDHNGQVLILRPDHTTPVSRLVATHLKSDPLPLKLYYDGPIFRQSYDGQNAKQTIEQFQAGVEHIGESGTKADANVIVTCINTLLKLGYTDFNIDIGHTDLIKGLSLSKQTALLNQDYISFGSIPERGNQTIIQDHEDLVALYQALKEKGVDQYITFNKGLVKQIHYYTGLIFEASIKGIRKVVATGGRYDNLLSKFGYPNPAVGFAIDMTLLEAQSC